MGQPALQWSSAVTAPLPGFSQRGAAMEEGSPGSAHRQVTEGGTVLPSCQASHDIQPSLRSAPLSSPWGSRCTTSNVGEVGDTADSGERLEDHSHLLAGLGLECSRATLGPLGTNENTV